MTVQLTSASWQTWLTQTSAHCLLLDIDGTLAPFENDPSHSKIPQTTLQLLINLQQQGVPLAVVTGRSLKEARNLLYPLTLPIGATHGLEIAVTGDSEPVMADFIALELPLIKQQLQHHCQQWGEGQCLTGWLIESKPCSVALHYRQNPALAAMAQATMQKITQHFPNWQLKQGKFVWELMPKGADKGQAVTRILAHFNQGRNKNLCPIFIGDDISDEAGFVAVQSQHGIGIKVGKPAEFTHAHFFVTQIMDVPQVLQAIYQHYQANDYQANNYQEKSPYFTPNESNV